MLFQQYLRGIAAAMAIFALLLYSFPAMAYTDGNLTEVSAYVEEHQRSCANETAEKELNTSEKEKDLSGTVRFAPLLAVQEYEEHFTQTCERTARRVFLSECECSGRDESVWIKNFFERFGCLHERLFTIRE